MCVRGRCSGTASHRAKNKPAPHSPDFSLRLHPQRLKQQSEGEQDGSQTCRRGEDGGGVLVLTLGAFVTFLVAAMFKSKSLNPSCCLISCSLRSCGLSLCCVCLHQMVFSSASVCICFLSHLTSTSRNSSSSLPPSSVLPPSLALISPWTCLSGSSAKANIFTEVSSSQTGDLLNSVSAAPRLSKSVFRFNPSAEVKEGVNSRVEGCRAAVRSGERLVRAAARAVLMHVCLKPLKMKLNLMIGLAGAHSAQNTT